MAQLPILPLKVDALLGDTNHLTAEEFGAYCRILFTMWRHEARLKDDADELARIAGLPRKRWDAVAERVMRPTMSAGGIVSQKRLSTTWADVQSVRQKRAHASEQRWKTKRKPNGNANGYQEHTTWNANQNQRSILLTSEQASAQMILDDAERQAKGLPRK